MKKYDPQKTWRDNLRLAPTPEDHPQSGALEPRDPNGLWAATPGAWSWCGLPLDSPLGIPAGPLLDSRWLLYYADWGFDWLAYKTVRSVAHPCHPLPNLVPVQTSQLGAPGATLTASETKRPTWAVSFGMPSQSPDVWRADVQYAREQLPANKQLIVSVVATQDASLTDPQRSLEQIAEDFATCARWAVDSGADGVVANFSCPNVSTSDGELYRNPAAAARVSEQIRSAIGVCPLALKIGWVADREHASALLQAVAPWIDGLVMTNSIAARVQNQQGEPLFDGNPRGICGDAIRAASVQQVGLFRDLIHEHQYRMDLVGVGGISTADHVQSYLDHGAQCVGIATAAMLDPRLAIAIREQWVQA